MKSITTMKDFAILVYDLLKSNRDVVSGTAGMTGEGKSVFSIQFLKEYCKLTGIKFDFDMMTWERRELMTWIDGEGEDKKGQLPEYSSVIADELIGMFYSRSWYEEAQKDSVKTFNSCRDRHLNIIGSVPNFWELDGGFRSRVRFYIFIPERGTAWIFQQENNPFSKDPWNVSDNCKVFRKKKNPFSSHNFLCEIKYPDLTKEESEQYQAIRNKKRHFINTESREKIERYAKIKDQRNKVIRIILNKLPKEFTQRELAEILDCDQALISHIKEGIA